MAAKNDEPALERVTYKPRIVSLLQQVYDSRSVITVHLKGDNNRYSSAVLDIDHDNNSLLLDELNPQSGHDRLLTIKEMNISARLAGVYIYFKSTLQSVEKENGIALYRIPIPERILYEQKRGAFRVRISAGIVLQVQLHGTDKAWSGTITDVSSTGIGALIETADIPIGEKLDCTLIPEEGEKTDCGPLEIRFAKQDDKTHKMRIGGRFADPTPQQRNQMEKFVMMLQREIIKRQKNI